MKKGGYHRMNYLQRVEQVNQIYMEQSRRGLFVSQIYRNYIRDQFMISRSTFYTYLSVPYKRELDELRTQHTTKERKRNHL